MRNSRAKTKEAQLLSALRMPVLRDGFHDALFGRRYAVDYDAWERVKQERYELGRRCGAVYDSLLKYNAGAATVDQLYSLLRAEEGLAYRFHKACVIESQINDRNA